MLLGNHSRHFYLEEITILKANQREKRKKRNRKKKEGKENNLRTVVRNEVQLLIPATMIIGVFLSLSKALSRGKFFEFCRKRVAARGINKREGRVGEG